MSTTRLTARNAIQEHWPEYLMEAWGLGMFMVSAGLIATLLEEDGIDVLNLSKPGIPDFIELSERLMDATGWKVISTARKPAPLPV